MVRWIRAKTLQTHIDFTDQQLKTLRATEWIEGTHFIRLNQRATLYNLDSINKWLTSKAKAYR